MTIEPALVNAVLSQVQVGRVVLGEAGRGTVLQANPDAQIETPYLQLVLTRLWERERMAGSNALHLATLEQLGGAEEIVRAHLQHAIDDLSLPEQAIAASVFDRLVTPSGTKIAQTARDLARYARVSEQELDLVLERLAGGQNRILRPVAPAPDRPDAPRYEIFHDVLSSAILEWRAKYEKGQEQHKLQAELERKRAEAAREDALKNEKLRGRRIQYALWGTVAAVILLLGIVLFAFQQRAEAISSAARAETQVAVVGTQAANAQEVASGLSTALARSDNPTNQALLKTAQAVSTSAVAAQTQAADAKAPSQQNNETSTATSPAQVFPNLTTVGTAQFTQTAKPILTRTQSRTIPLPTLAVDCMPNISATYLINDWHDVNATLDLIQGAQPPFIYVGLLGLDEANIREAKRRSPATVFIGRYYFESPRIQLDDSVFNYDPKSDAESAFGQMEATMEQFRGLVSVWEGYYEIQIDANAPLTDLNRQKARNYSAFTVEMARLMHDAGFQYAAYSLSYLHPIHLELWELLAPGLSASDYLAFHADVGWLDPNLFDQWRHAQYWTQLDTTNCGRITLSYQLLPADARKPILITE